jgi:N-acyl-D-amino-acid deacylase
MFDILIQNGWLADGTGNPLYPADIAIVGDRIEAVGRLTGAEARRTIDASGKTVTPGFIDAHSHTDWTILMNPTAESTIRQGITTEIVGNCGMSLAPLNAGSWPLVAGRLQRFSYDGEMAWSSYREWLDLVADMGTTCNLGWLVGHNTVRGAAGVSGDAPDEEQLLAMEGYVREAMEAGALGVSTGLEFEPGRQATTAEIIRVARVAGEYDGFYISHIRNRDARLQEAIEEFLTIVQESGTRGVVSHLNVRHNTGAAEGAWQRAVDTIAQRREAGLDVMIDTTPLVYGGGQAAAILPPWVRAEGPARTAELLKDPDIRARLRGECDRYWRFIHRGEWHRVALLSCGEFPELTMKSFVEISELWGKDPWDCFFDILAAAGPKLDGVSLMGRLFTDEHMAEMISHPLFNLGVDGTSTRIDGPLARQTAHPLNFAGMLHYLTWHVREKGTLRLEDAVRKMTSMPATTFGLKGRGLLAAGYLADVVVLDYEGLEEVSTQANPLAYARGVEYVMVNGQIVVDGGEHTGARPGKNLLRS